MAKETPEERQARIAAWHEQNQRKREQMASERRAEKQKHRESYDKSNVGVGHAPYPNDDVIEPEVVQQEPLTATNKPSEKEKLAAWYTSVIRDEELPTRERLSAANQLQKLQGWEKQEVKVEIDAVTRFFQENKPLIEAAPMPWARREQRERE